MPTKNLLPTPLILNLPDRSGFCSATFRRLMRRIEPLILLGLILACGGGEVPPEPPAPVEVEPVKPRIGFWVLAEGSYRVLEDPNRIPRLIQDANAQQATDLFVQIYRGGRAWFASEYADDAPHQKIIARWGESTLPQLIAAAHAEGIRVHAWFNVLNVAVNRDAPIIRAIGPQAVHVDREGRSLLDYPKNDVPFPDRLRIRLGTPGIWLDPAVPGVIEYLEAIVDELVKAAPELDGFHLDFIRHPISLPFAPGTRFKGGLEFGFGVDSKRRYKETTGQNYAPGEDWDRFRREAVDETVRRLGARIPEPWLYSAAVLPWADRAYLVAMQDWRGWLREDSIDFAVPMVYSRDDKLVSYLVEDLVAGVGGDRVWLGLGTWLFKNDAAKMKHQLALARAQEPAGIVLFSYDSLAEKPETLQWTQEALQ